MYLSQSLADPPDAPCPASSRRPDAPGLSEDWLKHTPTRHWHISQIGLGLPPVSYLGHICNINTTYVRHLHTPSVCRTTQRAIVVACASTLQVAMMTSAHIRSSKHNMLVSDLRQQTSICTFRPQQKKLCLLSSPDCTTY